MLRPTKPIRLDLSAARRLYHPLAEAATIDEPVREGLLFDALLWLTIFQDHVSFGNTPFLRRSSLAALGAVLDDVGLSLRWTHGYHHD
jgi:hypothetical protein